jgi:tetratricopeptide (TPR) repeat protein
MEAYYGPDAPQHADELAYHFARTDAPSLRGKAAQHLAAAGRKALERRADHEAINYLKAALERMVGGAPDGAPTLAELVPLLARAYTHVGRFEAAAELWATALAATPPDRQEHTSVQRALGMTYLWLGRHDDAHAHFDAGLEVARRSGDEGAIVRLLIAKAHCLHELGRGGAALEVLEPALPLAEKVGDPSLLARVHRALALLRVWIGPPEAAETHAQRAIELAKAVGDVSIEFWARWSLAVLSGMRGDTDRMADTIAQVDALADRARSPVLRLWTADMVVELHYGLGTWDEGLAYGQQAIALARSLNQRTILPRLLVWTSEVFTVRGQHEEAARLVDEAAEISGLDRDGPHDVHQVVPTYIGRAHQLLGIGRHHEAIEAALKGREIAAGTGYTLWAVHQLLPVLAEAYLWVNDVDRAAEISAELRAHSERIDHRLGLAWADACDALVRWRRGDGEGSIPLMREAAAALEAIPMVWHATRLRRHLSARLRDAGRLDDAKAELDRVWKVCVQLGAKPELERARQDYIKMDLRPPSEPRTDGWNGLTPAELAVARHLGQGLTDKAIAAARGGSERTIGTHLHNIYKKLDIGGPGARARLAVMVREARLLDDE